MIRTCLFDMGNVLLYFSHDLMCRQIGALCGKTGAEIRRLLFESGVQSEFERGRLSETEFHRWFEDAVGESVRLDEFRSAGSDIFQLNEPMPPILDALRERGCRLVLLSNTSVSHFEWAKERFDVLDRFDDYVLSYEVGAVKPEPSIFTAAVRKINCEPSECFYTDDIEEYVEIGRTFGVQAETFTGADDLRKHLLQRGVALD